MHTVLIIEDNERNLRLARDVLAYGGFATVEAVNAEDGLTMASTHLPDAILMDIQLPGIDGVTALQRLRADPATASIPVAALTAFAMGGDRERMIEAGFDDYIAKPIEIDGLLETVTLLCERRDRSRS